VFSEEGFTPFVSWQNVLVILSHHNLCVKYILLYITCFGHCRVIQFLHFRLFFCYFLPTLAHVCIAVIIGVLCANVTYKIMLKILECVIIGVLSRLHHDIANNVICVFLVIVKMFSCIIWNINLLLVSVYCGLYVWGDMFLLPLAGNHIVFHYRYVFLFFVLLFVHKL
jgi:hypothetical protein